MSRWTVYFALTFLLVLGPSVTTGQLNTLFGLRRESDALSPAKQQPIRLSLFTPDRLDRKCLMCKFSVSLVNHALKTKRGHEQVDKITNNFCVSAHLEAPLVCSRISKLFNSEVTKVLTYGVVTPDQVCGLLSNNTCGRFHSPLDDWEVNLHASKLIDQEQLRTTRGVIFANQTSDSPFKVIHLSDTHVDPNYATGSVANCQEPFCCQASSTPANSSTPGAPRERAGYWGTYGTCDVPLRTFVSALKQLNSTMSKSKDIEYIIWTGDIQPHDVWAQSKESALRVYEAVFSKVFKYLPDAILLPTFGNHEMIPVDSFSPSNLLNIAQDDSPVWLYQKFQAFWSRWLPAETEATITRDGFYAATVRPGLKVISLNTNFCHNRNFWLFINSTDPGNQLSWLVHELQLSELAHEKVHIIGHIPPGADDCMRVWSRNYNMIIERYANTISGQFYGHTHNSEFKMLYAQGGLNSRLKPIAVTQIGPSITTFIDLNPSFRIYTMDPKRSYSPIDYETYFMNLTHANQMGKSTQPQWQSAGLFSQIFCMKDILPQSMHDLLLEIISELKEPQQVKLVSLSPNATATQDDEIDADDDDLEDDDDVSNEEEAENKINGNATTFDSVLSRSSRQTDGVLSTPCKNQDKLYELYRLFSSYSDKFDRATFAKMTIEEKRQFICHFLIGRSHDPSVCKRLLPSIDLPTLTI